jgi:DNA-binding phage protein
MAATTKQSTFLIGIKGKVVHNQEDIISEIQSVLDATTTYQLAKKTGLTCDTIHRVKHNNMKDPRISTILKLLNACGKKLIIVDDKLW